MKTMLPLTKFQDFMERTAWSMTVFTVAATLVRFHRLPYRVPTHFDMMGQPDGWGERSFVFLMAGVMVLVCALISVANRAPLRWVNLPFKVKEGREDAVLSAVRDMSTVLQTGVALLFLIIQLCTLFFVPLSAILVWVITAVMMVTIGVGVWRCWKKNTTV